MNRTLLALSALALPLADDPVSAQARNDAPLHNGADALLIMSDPSVGSDLTATPPVLGDLYWRAYSGERFLSHQHGAAGASTMSLDGFYEELHDTDWSTSPSFYDRVIGPANASASSSCALEPAFLQDGLTTEVTISLGPSGFGNPCSIVPSLCSPPGSTCPPTGFTTGWLIDISLASSPGDGVVVPADGTSASDLAVTYLLPDGMPAFGGTCGLGDYTMQYLFSVDETQADDCGGQNAYSGFHQPSTGVAQDSFTDAAAVTISFHEPILNPVADSGFGVEVGGHGGGALNGLKLDTQGGGASLGFEVRDFDGLGDWALVYGDFSGSGPPGAPFMGAYLLVRPDRDVPHCFRGTIVPTTFLFTSEATFTTCQEPIDPVVQTRDVYWQALIYDATDGSVRNTNRVKTTLY